MKKSIKYNHYTLVELLAAMGVFSVLMLLLMQFFSSAQRLWTESEKRTSVYADARVAMDLISSQLQTSFFETGNVPFHQATLSTDYSNIAFVTNASFKLDKNSTSKIYEVGYKVDTANQHTLKIYFIGDNSATGWDFYGSVDPLKISDVFSVAATNIKSIIPYVTEFKLVCYNKAFAPLGPPATVYPYSVYIQMSLLDKRSYNIWRQILLAEDGIALTDDVTTPSTQGGAKAKEFLKNNQRTFSRMVYIGERGQP